MPSREWQVLNSALLVDRRPWIYLSEQDVLLPNGSLINGYITWEEREYTLVVALTGDGIPLVHQYKHGLRSFSLDLPGGYLNAGEEPLIAARRELFEETGLVADSWMHLGSLVLDNNRGHARAHLFLARGTRVMGPPCPDETEDLVISFYTSLQLQEMVHKGQITSLPSVAALLMAMQELDASPLS